MICTFTLPYQRSYLRVKRFQAGDTVGWGTEARQCPIRKIEDGHWEIRCVDATANMYLALSVLFSSGLLGIEKQEELLWKDVGITGLNDDPASALLPRSLGEALNLVKQHRKELETNMMSKAIGHFVALKRYEIGRFEEMDPSLLDRMFVEQF